jgi:hypothetical protein
MADLKANNDKLKKANQQLNEEQENLLTLLSDMEMKMRNYKKLLKQHGENVSDNEDDEDEDEVDDHEVDESEQKRNVPMTDVTPGGQNSLLLLVKQTPTAVDDVGGNDDSKIIDTNVYLLNPNLTMNLDLNNSNSTTTSEQNNSSGNPLLLTANTTTTSGSTTYSSSSSSSTTAANTNFNNNNNIANSFFNPINQPHPAVVVGSNDQISYFNQFVTVSDGGQQNHQQQQQLQHESGQLFFNQPNQFTHNPNHNQDHQPQSSPLQNYFK